MVNVLYLYKKAWKARIFFIASILTVAFYWGASVLSGLMLPVIPQQLFWTLHAVDGGVQQISFLQLRVSKGDFCEALGSQCSPFLPPSLLLVSLSLFALPLHDFLPAPLSPESLENPSDQRWVSLSFSTLPSLLACHLCFIPLLLSRQPLLDLWQAWSLPFYWKSFKMIIFIC